MNQRIKEFHVPCSPPRRRRRVEAGMFHVSGLTLIEVVVALGVLMIGLGATVTLIVSSLAYSQRNEQSIVVSNLAREGIEAVRAIRDQMDQGFSSVEEGTWAVDGSTASLNVPVASVNQGSTVSLANCSACKIRLVGGRYLANTSSGVPTPYARAVEVIEVNPSVEKKIISTVEWSERGRTHVFQLETRLFNWR